LPEAGLAGLPQQARVQQLDRGRPLEAPVAAFGPPDAAHAALAHLLAQRIGPQRLPRQRRARRRAEPPLEEPFERERFVFGQQHPDVSGERGVARGERLEPGGALLAW
jgi:hypothetical protein